MNQVLLSLFLSFGKIGLISLGGGNSMLKLLEYESVTYRQWISEEEFINMLGSSFLFPGLTAVKLTALIGYKVAGFWGLCCAVFSLNIPGLLMVIGGFQLLTKYNNPNTTQLMICLQYGALALLAAATYSIGQSVISNYPSLGIGLSSCVFFLALAFFNLSPFWGFLAFITLSFMLFR